MYHFHIQSIHREEEIPESRFVLNFVRGSLLLLPVIFKIQWSGFGHE